MTDSWSVSNANHGYFCRQAAKARGSTLGRELHMCLDCCAVYERECHNLVGVEVIPNRHPTEPQFVFGMDSHRMLLASSICHWRQNSKPQNMLDSSAYAVDRTTILAVLDIYNHRVNIVMRLISAFIQSLYTFTSLSTRIRPTVNSIGIPLNRTLTAGRWPFLGAFFATQKDNMTYPDDRSSSEWQAVLNKEQFRILREKGTEAPFSGEYDKHYPTQGVYECAGCKAPLYKAEHKFKSGCGWPAYFDAIPGAVTRHTDSSFGMARTEIVCSNCGGHLGHVFKGEGYATPTDERHCVNSISLKFSSADDKAAGTEQAK